MYVAPSWILSQLMMTCLSRSSRESSWKNPSACMTSCCVSPKFSKHPRPSEIFCSPDCLPTADEQLKPRNTVKYRNKYKIVSDRSGEGESTNGYIFFGKPVVGVQLFSIIKSRFSYNGCKFDFSSLVCRIFF